MDWQSLILSALPFPDRYITGFADMEGLLAEQYKEYRYAISFARRLDDAIVDSIKQGPNKAYLDHYRAINAELSQTTCAVSELLKLEGIANLPITPTRQDTQVDADYFKTFRTSFPHKTAATRAGLGWIGKTALLITGKFGPRVRLATILLQDRLLEPGAPIEKSWCNDCAICVAKCPGQAANGTPWDIHTDRDLFYSALKCRETARGLSMRTMGESVSLCGICIAVCPKGKRAPGTN